MQIDLTGISVAIVVLLTGLVIKFLIPVFNGKVDADTRNEIFFWVKIAVEAAEMVFKGTGLGAAKKQYVKEFLEEHGFKLDEKELDLAIESAVFEMKNAIKDESVQSPDNK